MFERNLLPPATGWKCTWLPRWSKNRIKHGEKNISRLKPKKGKKRIKDKDRCRPMVVAWRVGVGFTLGGMEKEKNKMASLVRLCLLLPLCDVCSHSPSPTHYLLSSYVVLIV